MQWGRLSWTTILEIVGIFSIVGSLMFVGLQIRQDREIASAENVMLVVSEKAVWTELLAENGAVWIKGNSGADLTDEEALTYRNLAELRETTYFAAWFRNQRVPGGNPSETFVYEWAALATENEGLMRYWRESTGRQERKYEQLGLEGEPASLWRRAVNDQISNLAEHNER